MIAEDAISSADSAEIEEMANSMGRDLCFVQSPVDNFHENSNSFQIHRVHQLVRQIDRFAYEPFVVSIGPYHHQSANLQFMERLKWKCLDYILKLNCRKNVRDYIVAISDIENQARACYSDEIKLDSKSFRRMLLLDGCFILVFFNGIHGVTRITKAAPASSSPDSNVPGTQHAAQHANSNNFMGDSGNSKDATVVEIKLGTADVGQRSSDNEDSTRGHKNSVVQWYGIFALLDLFLLENQIPFFVVRKLHEVLVGSNMENILAENISNHTEENLQYFTGAFGPYERPNDFCHLLHLCHMHFKPRIVHEGSNHVQNKLREYLLDKFCKLFNISFRHGQDEWNSSHNLQSSFLQSGHVTRWRRATQYHEAGIVFKKKEFLDGQKTHSLLDVTFHNGLLEIPCLSVDDRTGSLFLETWLHLSRLAPNLAIVLLHMSFLYLS
ncbi:unnamed protein product [Urochloa decumbens]|uniref:Uncharacterized protein n=1 Tax=Urochloa decumbens TaxID=240449 RepID=A0ABC9DQH2_9POAL